MSRPLTKDEFSAKAPKKKLPPIDTSPFIEATKYDAGGQFLVYGWRRIVLPYPPSMNMMFPTGKQGIRYLSEKGKRFKKAVESIALAIGLKPLTGRIHVFVDLYRPQKSGDCDNFQKAIFDAMKTFAWNDDSQIQAFGVNQHEDPRNPRAEVRIRLVGGETMNFEELLP